MSRLGLAPMNWSRNLVEEFVEEETEIDRVDEAADAGGS